MSTVQDIITGAVRKIGVLRKNEAPSANESADALEVLNDMVESWSNESLLLYATVTESFSITPASSYSIGSGQTLNTVRPLWIKTATVTVGTIDYEVMVVNEEDFQTQIAIKSLTGYIPQYLSYNNAYPYGTIKLWPLLNQSATLTLQSEKALSSFSATTDTFSMPPGWSRALKSNLALRLAPEYGLPPDPMIIAEAKESKANIKKQAIKAHPLTYKESTQPQPNIYSGF